jgi:hypothetical protein
MGLLRCAYKRAESAREWELVWEWNGLGGNTMAWRGTAGRAVGERLSSGGSMGAAVQCSVCAR